MSDGTSREEPRAGSEDRRPVLDVCDLRVAFPTGGGEPVTVVRGVTFSILERQRIGIVGESGSGKSLTALAIMRLVRVPGLVSGAVHFGNHDLLALPTRRMSEIRGSGIAMVYQDPLSSLNPLMPVGKQIDEAIRAHESIGRRTARERTIGLLDDVGIARATSRVRSYPHELSGGMRQRVMIAMALAGDPALLIADEITSALDVTTQARILDLLLELVRERGTAVMFITHDLGIAAGFCTDVHVMYAGRIVERSGAQRLFRQPVHPYSLSLLQSLCHVDMNLNVDLPVTPGQPPLAHDIPDGCAFHPRCSAAKEICHYAVPEPVLLPAPAGGMAECHFAQEIYDSQVSPDSGDGKKL